MRTGRARAVDDVSSKAELSHWLAPAGLGLAVAGSALVFSRAFDASFTFPKYLALWAGLAAAALGAALSRGRERAGAPLDAPLAAMLAVMALSLPTAPDRLLGVLGARDNSFGLWPSAALMALLWLSSRHAAGREARLLKVALGAYGLVGFYAALQAVGFEPFSPMPPLPYGRAYATLGSPVALGECMALLLPLALHWSLEKRVPAAWACLAALAAGLLASISRGAWLSAAAGCGLYLLWRARSAPEQLRRRLAAALLAVLMIIPVFAWRLRTRPLFPGDGGRAMTWRASWELFRERPLLGWGVNNFVVASRTHKTPGHVLASQRNEIQSHAHNDFLHVMATTGLLGLAAYVWFLLALARAGARAVRDPAKPWAAAVVCGLIALFINMKVNPAPLGTLACAALFAGLLAPAAPTGTGARRSAAFFLLAGAAASLLLVLRLAAADLALASGRRALNAGQLEATRRLYARALRLNPWDIDYRLAHVNALSRLSSRISPSPLNRTLLEEAEASAREGARLHPNHPDAHYAVGIVGLNLAYLELSLRGVLGDLEEARRALDRALALDPTYASSLKARLAVAEVDRDAGKIAELKARIVALGGD